MNRRPSIELASMEDIVEVFKLKDVVNQPVSVKKQQKKIKPEPKQPQIAQKENEPLLPGLIFKNRQTPTQQLSEKAALSSSSSSENMQDNQSFQPINAQIIRSVVPQHKKFLPLERDFRSVTPPIDLQRKQAYRIHRRDSSKKSLPKHQNQWRLQQPVQLPPRQTIVHNQDHPMMLISIAGRNIFNNYTLESKNYSGRHTNMVRTQFYPNLNNKRVHLVNNKSEDARNKEAKEKKIKQAAGKAILHVQQYLFFQSKQKQPVLELRLRQRIQSDLVSKKIADRMEKVQRRAGNWSLKGVRSISKINGVKYLQAGKLAKRVLEQKAKEHVDQFKNRIDERGKKRLVL